MAALALTCASIRARFGKVSMLSTDELMELMNSEDSDRCLVLLDVRGEEEFQVSQIPNAINIGPNTEMRAVLAKVNEEAGGHKQPKTVVAYCSVGYRSSLLIEQLAEHVKTLDPEDAKLLDLFNLEGSIFKWAMEGKTLIQPHTQRRTSVVHPYSVIWGKLLDHNLRSYTPKVEGTEKSTL